MKFRVWNERKKSYFIQEGFNKDNLYLIGCNGDLYFGSIVEKSFLQECEKTPDIIEFSTGLFDKNGKEIYEGDIFCADSTDDGDLDEYEYTVHADDINSIIALFYYYRKESLEIIGNIHENPELLEKKRII